MVLRPWVIRDRRIDGLNTHEFPGFYERVSMAVKITPGSRQGDRAHKTGAMIRNGR